MIIHIQQAVIVDPSSPFNGKKMDLLLTNGIITAIDTTITAQADKIIHIAGLHISPGWTDIFCQFHHPGGEHKETLETGTNAAAAGGFTDVLLVPNTNPVSHTSSQITYLTAQQQLSLAATLHPVGAVTKNCQGEELTEMYDMKAAGGIAFSDGWQPIQSTDVLLKALRYIKAFNGIIVQLPDTTALSKFGYMHEGIHSVRIGMPAVPAIAESLMIARDIELLRYTQSRLHVTGISTSASVALIRAAKAEGLAITCSVTPYHLYFTDNNLTDYDTNLKVTPPLRPHEDVEAVRTAVLDGTIDCITSHHYPHEKDSKICEFAHAKDGMEGLESCFGAVMAALPQLPPERLASLFSINAQNIFGLPEKRINLHSEASLTMYIPDIAYTFTKNHIHSYCHNNAFIGKELKGKVIGTIRGKNLFLND